MTKSDRPSTSRWLQVALATVLAGLLPGCDSDPSPDPVPVTLSILNARAQGSGAQVTIEGIVTVPPGVFASAMEDRGFAMQDATAGVYVKLVEQQMLAQGDYVRVTGILDDQNKLMILKAEPAAVEPLEGPLEGTLEISPKTLDTGAVDEDVEGQLVHVTGTLTQTFFNDSPDGYKLFINDGSGEVGIHVHITANLDIARLEALTIGQSLTVVGLAAQYDDVYEVAPRGPADLTVK